MSSIGSIVTSAAQAPSGEAAERSGSVRRRVYKGISVRAHPGTTRRYAMYSPEQFQDADADCVAGQVGLENPTMRLARHAGIEVDLALIGSVLPNVCTDSGMEPDILVRLTAGDVARGRDPETEAVRRQVGAT